MTLFKIALAAGAAILFTAGCAKPAPPTVSSSVSEPSTTTAQQSPFPSPADPNKLEQIVSATGHPDHDQLVFEFGGTEVSLRRIEFVSEVREDPSDRPVPLAGTAFLEVVFDGTLNTVGSGSGDFKPYDGPKRVAIGLPVVKEVAVSGDFEMVLSFGVGLSRPACVTAKTYTSPGRLVIDFWYDRAHQPADADCAGMVNAH